LVAEFPGVNGFSMKCSAPSCQMQFLVQVDPCVQIQWLAADVTVKSSVVVRRVLDVLVHPHFSSPYGRIGDEQHPIVLGIPIDKVGPAFGINASGTGERTVLEPLVRVDAVALHRLDAE